MEPELSLDPLTGAHTRALLTALPPALDRQRAEGHLALLLIDLDHFKSINDAFGHTRGDQVLVEFARRARGLLRPDDALVRMGGDEFVVLLPGADHEHARRLAERLLHTVGGELFGGTPPVRLSLSIGCSAAPRDGRALDELFERADARAYRAKQYGRGRVVAEDVISAPEPLGGAHSRLIEREHLTDAAVRLLDQAAKHPRAFLRVEGVAGSGRTRALAEIGTIARLRGLLVLELAGAPARRGHLFGAFAPLREAHPDLPAPALGAATFAAALAASATGRYLGTLLCVDNYAELDPASADFLAELLHSPTLPPTALAYSIHPTQHVDARLSQLAPTETIPLEPLSQTGVAVWLRQFLRWEAPLEARAWLHQQSSGLPARLRRGVKRLSAAGLLVRREEGWFLRPSAAEQDLGPIFNPQPPPLRELPVYQDIFVGRERELARIVGLLGQRRLVTLLGHPGQGKTRLAVQVAAEVGPRFADGAAFVVLAAYDRAATLARIAAALGLPAIGQVDPADQLLHYLRDRSLLLLLDQADAALELGPVIKELLEHAPGLHILATSRRPLWFPGEETVAIDGLPALPPEHGAPAQASPAVQLFLHRARAAVPRFAPSADDLAVIARACGLLEGLPLAIELAASAVGLLEPAALVAHLIAMGDASGEGAGVTGPIRTIFDSFWSLLSPYEQQVVRAMSVLRGPFCDNTACAIAGASPLFLEMLLQKAYLRPGPDGMFIFHELLRQYAEERLKAFPREELRARRRHSAHYLGLSREAARLAVPAAMWTRLGHKIENISAAWQWAITRADSAALARAVDGCEQLFLVRGMAREWSDMCERALAALAGKPVPPAPAAARLRARLRASRAAALQWLGQYERALELAHAVESNAVDDRGILAQALLVKGESLMMTRRYEEAQLPLSRCLRLAGGRKPRVRLAAFQARAQIAHHGGEYRLALHLLEQALAVTTAAADQLGEGRLRRAMGRAREFLGQHAAALDDYAAALELARCTGDRWNEARTRLFVGTFHSDAGEYAVAQEQLTMAMRICADLGDQFGEDSARIHLAWVLVSRGAFEAALEHQRRVLANARRSSDRLVEGWAHTGIGDCARLLGDFTLAEQEFDMAGRLFAAIDDPQGELWVNIFLSELRHEQGDAAGAAAAMACAAEIARDHELFLDQQITLALQAHRLLDLGRVDEAAASYGRIVPGLKQPHWLQIELLAIQARLGLARDNLGAALEAVHAMVALIQRHTTDGALQPARPYLWGARTLLAANAADAAELIDTAETFLRTRANGIADVALRQSFLENVSTNVALQLLATITV